MTAVAKRKYSPEELKKIQQHDHKKVRGIFRCFEPAGGSFTFSFKKHKGDPVEQYTLVDGESYTLPLMVAKHLNQNCWYPQHSHVLDANGNPTKEVGKKIQRCSFESLEFQELDDM
jgi:hypothetical protein